MMNPGDKVRHRVMGWTGTIVAFHPISGTYAVQRASGIPVYVPAAWLDLDDLDNGGAMAVFLFCLAVAFVIGFSVLRGAM
jgi:hypothetical protein